MKCICVCAQSVSNCSQKQNRGQSEHSEGFSSVPLHLLAPCLGDRASDVCPNDLPFLEHNVNGVC